jgi:hypothetical protein
MMAIGPQDDFVSRAAGKWRNSSERISRLDYYPLSAKRILYFF